MKRIAVLSGLAAVIAVSLALWSSPSYSASKGRAASAPSGKGGAPPSSRVGPPGNKGTKSPGFIQGPIICVPRCTPTGKCSSC
jgi:hypothetical protein